MLLYCLEFIFKYMRNVINFPCTTCAVPERGRGSENSVCQHLKFKDVLARYLSVQSSYIRFMCYEPQISPTELQHNKANTSDTKASILDLHMSISNNIVSNKIYDKRDDFDFEIVTFRFEVGDVPCSASYGVYIFQLIRFA